MAGFIAVGLIIRDRGGATIYDVIEAQSDNIDNGFERALKHRLREFYPEDLTVYVKQWEGTVLAEFLFDVTLAFPKGSHKAQPCVVFQGQSVTVEQFTRFALGV